MDPIEDAKATANDPIRAGTIPVTWNPSMKVERNQKIPALTKKVEMPKVIR